MGNLGGIDEANRPPGSRSANQAVTLYERLLESSQQQDGGASF